MRKNPKILVIIFVRFYNGCLLQRKVITSNVFTYSRTVDLEDKQKKSREKKSGLVAIKELRISNPSPDVESLSHEGKK